MSQSTEFEILQEIMESAFEVAPSGWLELMITFSGDEEQSSCGATVLLERGGIPEEESLSPDTDMNELLCDLQTQLAQGGREAFTTCKIHVKADGQYEASYGYDAIDWDALLLPEWNFLSYKIENLVKIRRDGKRIEAGMDAQSLMALGWRPDKIVRIEWQADGANFARDTVGGVLAKVTPDCKYMALLEMIEEAGVSANRLSVVDSRGKQLCVIPNNHLIDGKEMAGKFAWFEPAQFNPAFCFGVIFQGESASGNEQFQFDIAPYSGRIMAIRRSQ